MIKIYICSWVNFSISHIVLHLANIAYNQPEIGLLNFYFLVWLGALKSQVLENASTENATTSLQGWETQAWKTQVQYWANKIICEWTCSKTNNPV